MWIKALSVFLEDNEITGKKRNTENIIRLSKLLRGFTLQQDKHEKSLKN